VSGSSGRMCTGQGSSPMWMSTQKIKIRREQGGPAHVDTCEQEGGGQKPDFLWMS